MPALFRLVALLAYASIAHAQSPVGSWRTISDVDGKPTAIIEISEHDGQLSGVVKELFVAVGDSERVCGHCTGRRKGQPIVGMQILWGMRPDGDAWSGGAILDPENGKIYRATMHLDVGGTKLVVRGFIGFSLFGRSQTWERLDRPGPSGTRLQP